MWMFWSFIWGNWYLLLLVVAGLFTFNLGLNHEQKCRACFSLILMPRNYCTLWDGQFCDTGQPGSDFKGVIFTSPSCKNKKRQRQWEQWLNTFTNYIDPETSMQHIGIFNNYWPFNRELKLCKVMRRNRLIFLRKSRVLHQHLVTSHLVPLQEIQQSGVKQQRKYKNHPKRSRRMSTELRHGKLSIPIAFFLIWFSLATIHPSDCAKALLFSIQIDSSFIVKACRGSTLISLYPVFSGSFLHKLNLFSQITVLLSSLEKSYVDFALN